MLIYDHDTFLSYMIILAMIFHISSCWFLPKLDYRTKSTSISDGGPMKWFWFQQDVQFQIKDFYFFAMI